MRKRWPEIPTLKKAKPTNGTMRKNKQTAKDAHIIHERKQRKAKPPVLDLSGEVTTMHDETYKS